jgi:hypothetical protein
VLGDSNAAYRPWEADVVAVEESHIAFITNQHLGYLHAANPALSQVWFPLPVYTKCDFVIQGL